MDRTLTMKVTKVNPGRNSGRIMTAVRRANRRHKSRKAAQPSAFSLQPSALVESEAESAAVLVRKNEASGKPVSSCTVEARCCRVGILAS